MNDYETALRHNLPFKLVINDEGRLVNVPQEFMVNTRFVSSHYDELLINLNRF
jgi:valyl-tRNA synthetase